MNKTILALIGIAVLHLAMILTVEQYLPTWIQTTWVVIGILVILLRFFMFCHKSLNEGEYLESFTTWRIGDDILSRDSFREIQSFAKKWSSGTWDWYLYSVHFCTCCILSACAILSFTGLSNFETLSTNQYLLFVVIIIPHAGLFIWAPVFYNFRRLLVFEIKRHEIRNGVLKNLITEDDLLEKLKRTNLLDSSYFFYYVKDASKPFDEKRIVAIYLDAIIDDLKNSLYTLSWELPKSTELKEQEKKDALEAHEILKLTN